MCGFSSKGARARSRPVSTALLSVVMVLLVVSTDVPRSSAQVVAPVEGEVIDGYRPPAHVGGPGNRGWEYATRPGGSAVAVSAGVVVFAGPVGNRLSVAIDHGGGLRTTYSDLASVGVDEGDAVVSGTILGTTGSTFHFGVRRGGAYLDPATLFGSSPGEVRLVPRPIDSRERRARSVGSTPVSPVASRWWRVSSGVSVSARQHYTRPLAHLRVS